MAIGDDLQTIAPRDQWIFDSSGNMSGIKNPRSRGNDAKFSTPGQVNALSQAIGDGTWRVLPTILGIALSTPGFGSSAADSSKGSPAINYIASLPYNVGAVRSSVGNLYQCTGAGIAGAASAPTGTSSPITDGTVTWKYLRADPNQWAASTAYTRGQFRNNLGAIYYCIQGGTSAASGGPNVNNVNIADGTCLWNRVTNNYYDTLNGNDSNSGQNYTIPKKTLPTTSSQNVRYLLPVNQGMKLTGATAQNAPLALNGAGLIVTVYDLATGNENLLQKSPFTQGCQGDWWVAGDLANYFTIEGNSLDVGPYAGTAGQGIVALTQADPPLVRGLRVKGFGYAGLLGKNGAGARFEDCIVQDNQRISNNSPGTPFGGCGIRFEGLNGGVPAPAGTAQVVRCFISGSGEDAIWAAEAGECAQAMVVKDSAIRHYAEQQKFNVSHCDAIQRGTYPGADVIQRVIIEHQITQNYPTNPVGGSGNYVVGCCYLAVTPAGTVASGGGLTDCILISDCLQFNLQSQLSMTLTRCVGYFNYNANAPAGVDAVQSLPPSGGIFTGVSYTETGCRWVTGTLPPGFGVRYSAGTPTINTPAGEFIG